MGLVFGIAMGVGFGIHEDWCKDDFARGLAMHPKVHDANSQDTL